jgi:DNA-binding NarL/FixJ family response regulator
MAELVISEKISIAILEDHIVLQNRLVAMVEAMDLVRVCRAFSSNAEFISSCAENNYDVALVDLNLQDGSGLVSIRYMREHLRDCQPIVVSALSDGETVVEAISTGAVGYLHKDDSAIGVSKAIEMTLLGQSAMSPSIARRVFRKMQGAGVGGSADNELPDRVGLTSREEEVLVLMSKGLSYSDVASYLGISNKTVPVHVRNIYRKLQVNNKIEAMFEARANGYLQD